MLYKLIDEKQTFKQGGITLINKEVCGFWNTTIRKIAKKHDIGLPPHGVVSKNPLN